MFLDALIERAEAVAQPGGDTIGYAPLKASWVLRIGAKGEFISFGMATLARNTHAPSVGGLRTIGIRPNTGIDNFQYLLGVGTDAERTRTCHRAYREVLETIPHPAARAITAFLNNPGRPLILPLGKDPTSTAEYLMRTCAAANHPDSDVSPPSIRCEALCGATILVDVEGYPEWWCDPRVRNVHQARIRAINAGKTTRANASDLDLPECSMCGERRSPTRIFQRSRLGVSLISFNPPSTWAYGREQGAVVPTCETCAGAMTHGLDDLLASHATFRSPMKDSYFLWWAEDHVTPTWALFDTILDADTAPEAVEAALATITDGHFAHIEKATRATLALLRYARVSATAVRANLRRWRAALGDLGPSIWVTAGALTTRGSRATGMQDPEHATLTEIIHLSLITDEPVPRRTTRPIERWLLGDPTNARTYTNQRRAAFLIYANPPEPEVPMPVNPTDLCVRAPAEDAMSVVARTWFYLGRCFARLEWLQRRVQSKTSIRQTHYTQIRYAPRIIHVLFEQYATRRSMNGATRVDHVARDLLAETHEHFHDRATLADRDQFHHGYSFQERLQHAYGAAKAKACTAETPNASS